MVRRNRKESDLRIRELSAHGFFTLSEFLGCGVQFRDNELFCHLCNDSGIIQPVLEYIFGVMISTLNPKTNVATLLNSARHNVPAIARLEAHISHNPKIVDIELRSMTYSDLVELAKTDASAKSTNEDCRVEACSCCIREPFLIVFYSSESDSRLGSFEVFFPSCNGSGCGDNVRVVVLIDYLNYRENNVVGELCAVLRNELQDTPFVRRCIHRISSLQEDAEVWSLITGFGSCG